MLIIPMLPDTASASKALDEWIKEQNKRAKLAPQADTSGLEDIKKKAGEANEKLEELVNVEKLEKFRSWFSDLRDVVDITTTSVFKLNDAEAQAASASLYLAEKGLTLGLSFGLAGGAIGATAGVLLGIFHYSTQVTQENLRKLLEKTLALEQQQRQAAAQTNALAQALRLIDTSTLSGATQALTATRDAIRENITEYEAIQEQIATYRLMRIQGLTLNDDETASYKALLVQLGDYGDRLAKLRDIRDASTTATQAQITAETSKGWLEVGDIINRSKKSNDDLKDTASTARDNLEAVRDELKLTREEASKTTDPKTISDLAAKANALLVSLRELGAVFTSSMDELDNRSKEAAEKLLRTQTEVLRKRLAAEKATSDAYVAAWIEANNKVYNAAVERAKETEEFQAWNAQLAATETTLQDRQLAQQAEARARALSDEERYFAQRTATYEAYLGSVSSIFGEVTGQIEENVAAGKSLFDSMGLAAQRGVAQTLKSYSKQWGALALGELAAAFASLALGPVGGMSAAEHFAASTTYGLAAAATGFGGALIGGRASAKQTAREEADEEREKKSGGSGGFGGSTSGRASDPGPTQMAPVIVYMGGGPGSTNIYSGSGEEGKAQAGMWFRDATSAADRAGPQLSR